MSWFDVSDAEGLDLGDDEDEEVPTRCERCRKQTAFHEDEDPQLCAHCWFAEEAREAAE